MAVDLSPLSPGGYNGGIKTAVFATLRYIENQSDCGLRLQVYARPSVLAEIAPLLRKDTLCTLYACEEGERPQSVEAADVCYCPIGYSAFSRSRKPTIVLVADTLHRDFPCYLPPDQVANREVMWREMLSHADRIQAISQWTADQVRHHFHYPPNKIFVARPFVHNRWRQAKKLATSTTAPFFIYPANFWPHKNHETLLAAYRIYRTQCSATAEKPWPLILTGFPCERKLYLQHIAAVLDIDDIKFLGHVPDAELGTLFSAAGIMVFPSVYEGLGMPLLEAMAAGCPVIAGAHAAIPETVGEAAMLVETRNPVTLANAMMELATDQSRRAEMSAAGLAHARTRDPDVEYSHLVKELLDLGH